MTSIRKFSTGIVVGVSVSVEPEDILVCVADMLVYCPHSSFAGQRPRRQMIQGRLGGHLYVAW